jgi:hypothetical protein
MLHVVPPQSALDFIEKSELADKAGWVEVHKYRQRAGQELLASYDGYASCPLVTGYGKLILAEFAFLRCIGMECFEAGCDVWSGAVVGEPLQRCHRAATHRGSGPSARKVASSACRTEVRTAFGSSSSGMLQQSEAD